MLLTFNILTWTHPRINKEPKKILMIKLDFYTQINLMINSRTLKVVFHKCDDQSRTLKFHSGSGKLLLWYYLKRTINQKR